MFSLLANILPVSNAALRVYRKSFLFIRFMILVMIYVPPPLNNAFIVFSLIQLYHDYSACDIFRAEVLQQCPTCLHFEAYQANEENSNSNRNKVNTNTNVVSDSSFVTITEQPTHQGNSLI